jgi:uncharacterized YccA/Bax inhibitor family protein
MDQSLTERLARSPVDHFLYAGVSFAVLLSYLLMYAKGGMKETSRMELLIMTAILGAVILIDCWQIVR